MVRSQWSGQWRVLVESWITDRADWFGRRTFVVQASSLPAALRKVAALPAKDYLAEDKLTLHTGKAPDPKPDLDRILIDVIRANNIRAPMINEAHRAAVENAIAGCPGAEVRTLMTLAWLAGYEVGREVADQEEP